METTMNNRLYFEHPVSFDYLNIGYGLEKENLPVTGIYGILCKDDGSTDVERSELVSTNNYMNVARVNEITESFDKFGYELKLENGDIIVYYLYEQEVD